MIYKNIEKFVEEANNIGIKKVYKKRHNEKFNYFNIACAFDIETTSVKIGEKKFSFMYMWQFGIDDLRIYGRTWEEFKELIQKLKQALNISLNDRLVCFIHNLEFEFQFIKSIFNWHDIFALDERQPLYAITEDGIEFRCSYKLTDLSLEDVGKNLKKYKCEKKVGQLDYTKIRHFSTPLTDDEIDYGISDIDVVICKIKELIEENYNNIGYIPLTKTGFVRRDVKKAVLNDKVARNLVRDLKLTKNEYILLKAAFQGGYVHSNSNNSCITEYDVTSFDFSSSFPSVMVSEMFPMSNGTKVEPKNKKEFNKYLKDYCCVFEITMKNVRPKSDDIFEFPISVSKCEKSIKDTKKRVSNGRIEKADKLKTIITNVDFEIYEQFYKFDYEIEDIKNMYIYKRGYLPKPIIELVLDYYKFKNELKGNSEQAVLYQWRKALLNAIYGMMIMDVVRGKISYEDNWDTTEVDIEEQIKKYNDNKARCNWYPWGVFITAYSRRNLFSGILSCGIDYIYSDTDSIKIKNKDKHIDYINAYNKYITSKSELCLEYYGLDKKRLRPMEKQIGVWEFDGHYKRFKTLGAKEYLVEKDNGEIEITMAGLNKKAGSEYFASLEEPFEEFKKGTVIDAEKTKKLGHFYIDEPMEFEITDYLGNTETVFSPSGVYLEPVPFRIGEMTVEDTIAYAFGIVSKDSQSFK